MKSEQIEKLVVKNIEAKPGFGLSGNYDGRHLLIGNKSLMDAEEISFGPALRTAEQEMEQGRTVIFAAIDGQVAGLLSLTDRLRPDARSTVDELKKTMERLDMLSGDNHKTANAVARMAGLDQFQAEVKPDQKKFIVDSYRKAGFKVAMIGDGINDAPALAAADVGIAVGNGTDVAIETADVILAGENLGGINRMFYIARESMKVIRQNLFWAFFYNVIAIPVAAGALYPVMGLTLSPVIAAAAMAFSSIFVVTNSLRLNRLT
jgi:P-type E1-E2 ATPase